VLRCCLKPFREQESREYIELRLGKAGVSDQTIFSPEMIAEIHLRSQGIPRVINTLCDNLLLTCFAMETRVATLVMLDEICNDLRLDWPGRRSRTVDSDVAAFFDHPQVRRRE
jgi:general secretion pathway protein A